MCLAASKDFASLGAVRFLVGFTEGAVAPSFMIITSNWYKKSEHQMRIAYVFQPSACFIRRCFPKLTGRAALGCPCLGSRRLSALS